MLLNVQETDLIFDGVTVRMYEPAKRSGVLPGIMYYHGGGFVFGSLCKHCEYCLIDNNVSSLLR